MPLQQPRAVVPELTETDLAFATQDARLATAALALGLRTIGLNGDGGAWLLRQPASALRRIRDRHRARVLSAPSNRDSMTLARRRGATLTRAELPLPGRGAHLMVMASLVPRSRGPASSRTADRDDASEAEGAGDGSALRVRPF